MIECCNPNRAINKTSTPTAKRLFAGAESSDFGAHKLPTKTAMQA
jgi:hypothetical protein